MANDDDDGRYDDAESDPEDADNREDSNPENEEQNGGPEAELECGQFDPPLYLQRYDFVAGVLTEEKWTKRLRKVSMGSLLSEHFITQGSSIFSWWTLAARNAPF